MTLRHWFTQYEYGGFPIERAALARAISPCCTSAANGKGWFAKLARTWRKVPRGLLSMLSEKRKPSR